jgi:serine/threonine-protein kinase RsbT
MNVTLVYEGVMAVPDEAKEGIRVVIRHETDIVVACQKGRDVAAEIGFGGGEQVAIAIAISEVARNILDHAGHGEILLQAPSQGRERSAGIVIVASDRGPGIADVNLALQDGYSTRGSLGVGLPGAKRLMDEIEVVSKVSQGTTITMRKWVS